MSDPENPIEDDDRERAETIVDEGDGNPGDLPNPDALANPDDTDPDDDEPKKSWILPVGLIVLILLLGFWAISMLIPPTPGPVIAAADDDDSAVDESMYVDVDPDHCRITDTSPHARKDRLAQCQFPNGDHTYCWWRGDNGVPVPLTCERTPTTTYDPTAGS